MGITSHQPRNFAIAFAATLAVLGGGSEISARLAYALRPPAHSGFATIDSPLTSESDRYENRGPYQPHQLLTLRQFSPSHRLNREVTFTTNNLGWVSANDYLPKQTGEFRIAFIGDSLTASITNSKPWVDVVQRELQSSFAPRHITALNLGVAASGLMQIEDQQLPVALRLGADLIVLNLTYASLGMPDMSAESALNKIENDRISIAIQCYLASQSNCMPSLMLRVDRHHNPTPEELETARLVSADRTQRFRFLSPVGSLFFRTPSDDATTESQAISAIHLIKSKSPRFLVTINPLLWAQPSLDAFIGKLSGTGIDVADVRKLMPVATDAERTTWYNMPLDGHWSDKGAVIYGTAIASAIKRNIKAGSL